MYNQQNYFRLLIVVGILFFVYLLFFSNNTLTFLSLIRNVSMSTTFALIFHFLFKRFLWKVSWFPVQKLIVTVPNLHGTWEGQLQYTQKTSASEHKETKNVVAFIRQSFDSISVEVQSKTMKSKSSMAGILTDPGTNTQELCYTYLSQAYVDTLDNNPWHDGTAKLEILKDKNGFTLKGNYWTLRRTNGILFLKRISKKVDYQFSEVLGE